MSDDRLVGRLEAELRMAQLSFKRIAQEAKTPKAMREIALARAVHIGALIDRCAEHGTLFISPGICPFCAEGQSHDQ